VVRKPERDQESQLTSQCIDPHKDVKKERPHILVPCKQGDEVSLEHREDSLSSPIRQNEVGRKEYGFRLLDPATKKVVQDRQWLSTPEARDHVIRQSMSSGQFTIETDQREARF
jgi:hypothetical protein